MTECARCGSCCDRITTNFNPQVRACQELARDDLTEREARDARFLYDNWHELYTYTAVDGEEIHVASCDKYDPASKLCLAHDDRPAVCSGFPWYGREPSADSPQGASLAPQCSFNADVRTMLPIVEVRHASIQVG